jgi:hypothetical protein
VYKHYLKKGRGSCLTSFEICQYDDCQIILVEDFPCERKEQLIARERYHIENNECVNKVMKLNRTKEDVREYLAKYRQDNSENIKEKGVKYYQDNQEKIKANQTQYRQDNQDKFKEKHTCLCGGRYIYQNLSQHTKTKRHKNYEQMNMAESTESTESTESN